MASELELLKSNRQELVGKIRFVKPFLDRLLQHGEIVEEEYENIVTEKTRHDQARALLDVVTAKGRRAFRHFREHLKKVNPELEEVLHRCSTHNLRLKLYCEVCESLLCRQCHQEDHKDHRCTSLVADADAIRREFTAFKRENRKLLVARKDASNICNVENMQKRASFRMKILKEKFCTKVDEEYRWFLKQLEDGDDTTSDTQSVSSIADSGSVAGSETNDFFGWTSPKLTSPSIAYPPVTAALHLNGEVQGIRVAEDQASASGPETHRIVHRVSLKMHWHLSPPTVKELIELNDDEETCVTKDEDLEKVQFDENESLAGDDEATTDGKYIKEEKEPLMLNWRQLFEVWNKQTVQYSKRSTICPQGQRFMIL